MSPEHNLSDTQPRLNRYLRLLEITRDLSSTLDLDTLLNQIVTAAADVTGSAAASILLYDEKANELYFQSSTNLDTPMMGGLSVPIEGSIAGSILTSREAMVVTSAQDDPRHFKGVGQSTDFLTKNLLGVPLINKEKVVGVLEALNKEGEFTEEDIELLDALGSQAAVAIENARLFQQSDLIAELVHEIRTPLSSITTATHLMTRDGLPETQRNQLAETIKKETDRLSEMTTSFLDLARLESGRSQFRVEPVDLRDLLQDALQIMEGRITEQGLTLEWKLLDGLPTVIGDADKLRQVVINLVSNAMKYNSVNGKIIIGAGEDKGRVFFYVEDTGPGMMPEHVKSLFEKFFRVPGSEQKAQGTGLGLSITKKIVEAHGGEIIVESEPGKGTRLTVMLGRSSAFSIE